MLNTANTEKGKKYEKNDNEDEGEESCAVNERPEYNHFNQDSKELGSIRIWSKWLREIYSSLLPIFDGLILLVPIS